MAERTVKLPPSIRPRATPGTMVWILSWTWVKLSPSNLGFENSAA